MCPVVDELERHCEIISDVLFLLQITDIQQEHQREMEGLLENVRQLSRELRQQILVIDQFIPQEYQVNTLYLHSAKTMFPVL